MTRIRDLIFASDPYADLDLAGYTPDTRGWGGDDPVFARLIREVWPRRVLEIGAWKGASALHMARLLADLGIGDGEICCVDTWLGSLEFWLNRDDPEVYGGLALRNGYPSVYYTFLKNATALGFRGCITPFPVPSSLAAKFFAHHGIKFDLIYIDGSHDYDDVAIDILNCNKLLSSRGVVFGDDYDWPSVRQAVTEAAAKLGFAIETAGRKWVFRRPADYAPASGGRITLFTTIVNDARLLRHFLDHYETAGVSKFHIAVSPQLASAVAAWQERYRITIHTDHMVDDALIGGVTAVSEMRRRYQRPDEWAVVVDLDEFVEFDGKLPEILSLADAEGANVVRAIMWDRFTADGRIVPFEDDRPLTECFPIRAKFIHNVMNGAGFKGVLVKGAIEALGAHHTFAGEVVCSRQFDLSHYKWIEGSIDRLRHAYDKVVKSGQEWAVQYRRALEHYSENGRFAWEQFGGEWVAPASAEPPAAAAPASR